MADGWEDISSLDYYSDIKKKIPGIRVTSGYRTPEYQEKMRQRGYKPARNSGHLRGEKMDFVHPKGQDWLRKQIKTLYPEAQLNPEGDHLDVRFPGYDKAPALEGAADEGITNPNRIDDDGWEVVEPSVEMQNGPVIDPQALAPSETVAQFWDTPTPQAGLPEDVELGYKAVTETGSADDIRNFARQNGFQIEDAKIDEFIRKRDVEKLPVGYVEYVAGKPITIDPKMPTDEESFVRALGDPVSLLDEIGAIADSLGATEGRDNIFNTDKRWADLWNENQELNSQITARDFEENPISTLGGQIISGLPIPFGAKAKSIPELLGVGAGWGLADAAATGENEGRFDPKTLGVSAAAGAGITLGLGKAFQAIAKKLGGTVQETPEGAVIDVEGQIIRPTVDDINDVWEGPVPEFLKQAAKPKKGSTPLPEPVAEPVKANPKVAEVQAEVSRVQEGWTNAPETQIVDKLDELPSEVRDQLEADGVTDDVLGITHNGKVYVFANNVSSPADVQAVTYHESLGHYGLSQLFGEKLNAELMRLYKGNASIRNAVGDIKEQYPEDYPLTTLIEEALAKQSEGGQITQKFYEKMTVFVRQLAKRMGYKGNISDAEVRAIISQAHKKVVSGTREDGTPGGTKYMVTKGMEPGEPTNDNTIDLSAARDKKKLKTFHKGIGEQIAERSQEMAKQGRDYHEEGKLPLAVGERFSTPKGRETGQGPWKVVGHYVDRKDPEKFGYLVERGNKEAGDFESSVLLVSDPKTDARLKKLKPDFDRAKDVEGWQSLDGPSKYMLKDKRKAEPVGVGKAGNINLEHIKSTKDIEGFIRTAMKDVQPIRESHEDIMDFAKTLKVSPKEMKAFADEMEAMPGRMTAMRISFTTAANNLSTLARKIEVGGENADITLNRFAEDIVKFNALAESFSRAVGGAGRLLNSLKIDVTGMAGRAADIRYALKNSDAAFLADPENLKAIAKKLTEIENDTNLTPEARERKKLEFVRKAFEPTWDDYVAFLIQNNLYSGLSTQAANAMGAVTMGGVLEVPTKALAVGVGAVRTGFGIRKPNVATKRRGVKELERVTSREVTAYVAGMVRALAAGSTWKSTGRSFKAGTPEHTINRLETGRHTPQDFIDKLPQKYHVRKIVAPMINIISYPQRGLSAADQFFREILHTGHINAFAVREAFTLGLKGEEFSNKVTEILSDPFGYSYDRAKTIANSEGLDGKKRDARVKQLIRDPAHNLLLMANHATEVQQLLSEQSFLGKFASQWKAPKETQTGKVVRTLGIILLPASHTTDRALGAIVRHIPVLNMLDNESRKMWARGGAERDAVISRMIIGASLIAAFTSMSNAGTLTGDLVGTPDEKAKQRTNKKLENAIQIGDNQISIQRLDVISGIASMTATINEKYKAGELTEKGYVEGLFNVTGELLKLMNHNDFTRNISDLFQSMGPMGNPKQYVGRTVARMVVPNIVRQTNKEYVDPVVRSTRADDTMGGAISANIKAAIPGLSDDLPAQYDTYGREQDANIPMLGVGKTQQKETDPVVKELERLGATPGPVDKGDLSNVYPDAPADIVQEYQQLSGKYILEWSRELIESEEWDSLTDEERAKEIKKITADAREIAREELFNSDWEVVE